jgi:hypothetical protein
MITLKQTMQAVQKITGHKYTKQELKRIHAIANEATARIPQPQWVAENKSERDKLDAVLLSRTLAEYYKS